MKDYVIEQGATLRLQVTVKETGAQTAELFAKLNTDTITSTATFSGMAATLSTNNTDVPAGDYPYYIKITWTDGTVDILSTKGECSDGDCESPVITVCEVIS